MGRASWRGSLKLVLEDGVGGPMGGHPELGRPVRNGDRSPTYPGTLSSLEADRFSGGWGEGKCQGQGQGKLKSAHQKLTA